MSILIRRATVDDQPAIAALVRAGHLHTRSSGVKGFYVAQSDGAVVGTVQVMTMKDGARELRSLTVAPAHRGSKIVRALLRAAANDGPGPMYGFCDQSLERFYTYYGARRIAWHELPPSLATRYWVYRLTMLYVRLRRGRDIHMIAMKHEQPAEEARNRPD